MIVGLAEGGGGGGEFGGGFQGFVRRKGARVGGDGVAVLGGDRREGFGEGLGHCAAHSVVEGLARGERELGGELEVGGAGMVATDFAFVHGEIEIY